MFYSMQRACYRKRGHGLGGLCGECPGGDRAIQHPSDSSQGRSDIRAMGSFAPVREQFRHNGKQRGEKAAARIREGRGKPSFCNDQTAERNSVPICYYPHFSPNLTVNEKFLTDLRKMVQETQHEYGRTSRVDGSVRLQGVYPEGVTFSSAYRCPEQAACGFALR